MKTLRDLGPGDEVAIQRRWQVPIVARIARVTATQIVLEHGTRWQRDTGREISGARSARIAIVDDVIRDQAERATLIDEVRCAAGRADIVGRLSTDTLRTIAAALRADPATEGA